MNTLPIRRIFVGATLVAAATLWINQDQGAQAVGAGSSEEIAAVVDVAGSAFYEMFQVGEFATEAARTSAVDIIEALPSEAEALAFADAPPTSEAQIAASEAYLEQVLASDLRAARPSLRSRFHLMSNNTIEAARDPGQRMVGGGISRFEVTDVEIVGGIATVRADVTAWTAWLSQASDGSWTAYRPEGNSLFEATVKRQPDGTWAIWDFVVSKL